MPSTSPPSMIQEVHSDGGGEVPMDMDTKEDDIPLAPPPPTISGTGSFVEKLCSFLFRKHYEISLKLLKVFSNFVFRLRNRKW